MLTLIYLMFVLSLILSVTISKSLAQPQISLNSNQSVTPDGSICPNPILFSCITTGTTFLQWQKNGDVIIHFTVIDSISEVITNNFTVHLINTSSTPQSLESTLEASLSEFSNGDYITCVGHVDINRTITVSFSEVRAPPPAPLFSPAFSSLRNGEVSLTLTWDETFTTTHAVQMYCVRSDLCPGEQCVESDTPFSCPGLVAGGEYMFWVTAVNCGTQRGEESQPLVVRHQVPRMPTISSVVATYSNTSTAIQLVVSWEPVPEVQIIDQITEPIWYRVTVESKRSTDEDPEVMMVSCNQSEVNCSALFPLLEAADYTVSISAGNIVGGSNTTFYPNEIFSSSSSYYDPFFSFENCITSVLCSSSLDLSDTTRCVVRYWTDPSYTLLSDPVDGPLNSMFQLPLLEPTTTYYFQTSVLINSSLTVQVQEEFTTGEFDSRLLSDHYGMIIAGALSWVLSLVATIIDIRLTIRKDLNIVNSFKAFIVVVLVVILVIAAILWVAVGLKVGLQQNTCDLNWQGVRNGLIISVLVFSVLSLVTDVVILIILIFCWVKGRNVPVKKYIPDEIELERPQYATLSHGLEKCDEYGFEHEGHESHRWIGTTTKEGIVEQVKEEYSKLGEAATGSGGDGVYDTTRHGAPPKPIPNPDDPQYSHLQGEEEKKKKSKKEDKKKKEEKTKCLEEADGTGQPHPPPVPGTEEYRKLETHSQDQQATAESSSFIGSLSNHILNGLLGNLFGSSRSNERMAHEESPKPIPNPEDPQYSHLQGEEEKKKKGKKEDKKKKEDKTKPPQNTGEYQHLSHGTGQPHPPSVPGPEEEAIFDMELNLCYDEPNTGPRNLKSGTNL